MSPDEDDGLAAVTILTETLDGSLELTVSARTVGPEKVIIVSIAREPLPADRVELAKAAEAAEQLHVFHGTDLEVHPTANVDWHTTRRVIDDECDVGELTGQLTTR